MITKICLVLVLALVAPAMADSITTGPYIVTFDLGLRSDGYSDPYTVSEQMPQQEEYPNGEKITTYASTITDKTGLQIISLSITSYNRDLVIPDDLEPIARAILAQVKGVSNIQTSIRDIDSTKGMIASSDFEVITGINNKAYAAIYFPTRRTRVVVLSLYSWEVTARLWDSLHVA
jgi:hypothetical protein